MEKMSDGSPCFTAVLPAMPSDSYTEPRWSLGSARSAAQQYFPQGCTLSLTFCSPCSVLATISIAVQPGSVACSRGGMNSSLQQCPPLRVVTEFSCGEGCGLGQGAHAKSLEATCAVD